MVSYIRKVLIFSTADTWVLVVSYWIIRLAQSYSRRKCNHSLSLFPFVGGGGFKVIA